MSIFQSRKTRIAHYASTGLMVLGLAIAMTDASAQVARARGEPRVLSDRPDRTVLALEYLPAGQGFQKAGGIGLYRVSEDGPGLYMQFLSDLDRERPRTVGDPARFPEANLRQFKEAFALNIGATHYVSPTLTLFGGLGLVSSTPVTEKDDRLRRLSSTGRYYVEDTSRRENRIGVQVGVQFRVQNLVLGTSVNSEIGQPQFSVGYSF